MLFPWLKGGYSGTSNNGRSKEWTTSLQWTHSSPPTYIIIVHIFLPPKKGHPLNNGQNTRPQLVHYSEVPLYNGGDSAFAAVQWQVVTMM